MAFAVNFVEVVLCDCALFSWPSAIWTVEIELALMRITLPRFAESFYDLRPTVVIRIHIILSQLPPIFDHMKLVFLPMSHEFSEPPDRTLWLLLQE